MKRCLAYGVQLVVLVVVLTTIGACSKLDKLQTQIDEINQTLDRAQKNATDVGVISELGWLSKILRDSATGTPAEQKKAREDVARLFGVNEAELSQQQFFEVTLQVRDFKLDQSQQLEVDTKYLADVSPAAIKALFDEAPGNAWSPYNIRDPDEFRRTPAAIESLVRERAAPLFTADCVNSGRSVYCKTVIGTTADVGLPGNPYGNPSMQSHRDNLLKLFVSAILAPTEITGLPPAGSRNGQRVVDWGLSSGASPYVVAFVPQIQVKDHPKLRLYAWLHLRGHPEKILGAGHEVEGVDFADRCLGKISYPNPTPMVDSKASTGPLCWYAFDLFGAGARAQLTALAKEAAVKNAAK
jgi:hypothetical protein